LVKFIDIRPTTFLVVGFNTDLYKSNFKGLLNRKKYIHLKNATLQNDERFLSIFFLRKNDRFFKHISNGKSCTATTAELLMFHLIEQGIKGEDDLYVECPVCSSATPTLLENAQISKQQKREIGILNEAIKNSESILKK